MQSECVQLYLVRPECNFHAALCIVNVVLSDTEGQVSLLHKDEMLYYNKLQHVNRKLSYLSGRLAAKTAVGVLTNTTNLSSILIDAGVFKHPVVKVPNVSGIQVSISHCNNIAAAIAFTEEHPMGVDIEQVDAMRIDALKYVITPNEDLLISSSKLSFLTAATALWSAKESLSKILKTGFTTNPHIFEVNNFTQDGAYHICTFTHFTQYKAYIDIYGKHVFAITLPFNTNIELKDFSASFKKIVQVQ